MIEFLASDYLLRILANLLMVEVLIGLGVIFFVVLVMTLTGIWRLFHE